VVVFLDGADETEVALLDQVRERHAAAGEPLGHRDDLPEAGLKQAVAGLAAVLRDPLQAGPRLAGQRVVAFGELLLGAASCLDPCRQFGLLLGGQPRYPDDPRQVIPQRPVAVVGVRGEPEQETSAPGHGVVAARVPPGEPGTEPRVEIRDEQGLVPVVRLFRRSHDSSPSPDG
jgi:hypothetical protein